MFSNINSGAKSTSLGHVMVPKVLETSTCLKKSIFLNGSKAGPHKCSFKSTTPVCPLLNFTQSLYSDEYLASIISIITTTPMVVFFLVFHVSELIPNLLVIRFYTFQTILILLSKLYVKVLTIPFLKIEIEDQPERSGRKYGTQHNNISRELMISVHFSRINVG